MEPYATLWAHTRAKGYEVAVWKAPQAAGRDIAYTSQSAEGDVFIVLRPAFFKYTKRRKFEILTHELAHVLEFRNECKAFSVNPRNACTNLADTLEAQLSQLITNLRAA